MPWLSKSTLPELPDSEQILYQANPAMFRNHPIGFVLGWLLVPVFGLGLLVLVPWWIKCLGTELFVTERRTILRRGILSRKISDIMNEDVRNIQISQSFLQRLLGVGTVGVSSSGQSGVEIEVAGIPDPESVRELINRSR